MNAKEVIGQMKQNHQFTQDMITAMLNDPDLRLQIIRHISENSEAMQQMKMMLNSTSIDGYMMGNQMRHNKFNTFFHKDLLSLL